MLELTDGGHAQRSGDAGSAARTGVGKAPLVSLRIVQTQGESFEVARRTICFGLAYAAASVPDLADDGGALIVSPHIRPRQRMQAAGNVGLPDAEREIEVLLAIALSVGRLQLGLQLARVCLHGDASGKRQTDQGTKQSTLLTTAK